MNDVIDQKPTTNESIQGQAVNDGVLLVPGGQIKPPEIRSSKIILFCTALLILMGLSNLYSAASGTGLFWAQIRNGVLGILGLCAFGWFIPPRWLNTYGYWFYGFVCILLVMVDLIGNIAGGSQRWLRIGGFAFQPSEFAKIAIVIVVAKFFYISRLSRAYDLKDLLPLGGIISIAFALIFAQPDLGTAGVCALIAVTQLAFVRIKMKSIGIVTSIFMVVVVLAWFFLLHDYQKLRVLNLLNPELDPTDSGYNSLQSLIAVGSGKFLGKGFLKGTQNQLQFLPARHTDFAFAVFSEEHGFIGSSLLFCIFAIIVYSGLTIAKQARDVFSSLTAIGCTSVLFISFVINASMVLGMFPVVGVPLPFFSYGGTALIMFCCCIGILVGIERDTLGFFRKSGFFQSRRNPLGQTQSTNRAH